eukprot:5074394-Alexandrium_andersonii.AAC.1
MCIRDSLLAVCRAARRSFCGVCCSANSAKRGVQSSKLQNRGARSTAKYSDLQLGLQFRPMAQLLQ